MEDLCEGCGREPDSCNCPPILDDDFEPLEDGNDPDWDDYDEDITGEET